MGTTQELLNAYTGAAPRSETYTAANPWLVSCNGEVLEFNTPYTDLGNCANTANTSNTRQLAYALGALNGSTDPATNHAVTAYTENDPGANQVEFQTVNPISLPTATGRFITFSVNAAAENCNVSAPQYQFALTSGATTTPVGGVINACTSGTPQSVPAVGGLGARTVNAGTATSNGSVLFTGSSLGLQMTNANGSGQGNDAAFDDIKILDVTPQLDKSFSPASVEVGKTSTLTFTITNTSELAAKNGWSFTDSLPSGLKITSPAASTTCPSGAVTAPSGGTSVHVTGNLTAGMASCTATVSVTSAKEGTYTNDSTNVTASGLNPPGSTSVTFTAPPTFGCNAFGYLFQSPNGTTPPHTITQVDLASGATSAAGTTADYLNAVGFNPLDDYAYGWDFNTATLVRIGSDGTLTDLGVPAGMAPADVSANSFNAGDFDNAGHLWIVFGNVSPSTWYEIDLAPGSSTYGQVINHGSLTLPSGVVSVADWTFINGAFYGVSSLATGTSSLLRFTAASGLTIVGPVAGLSGAGSYGAAYTDAAGDLFIADNGTGTIYRINVGTATITASTPGPASALNDGARCASAPIPTITVKKSVAGRVVSSDQFTVALKNSANATLTSATTAGTATSASTTNWPVTQGATYTITDAMAAGSTSTLASYTPAITCTDKAGNTVSTGGSAPNWTLNVANPTDYTCTVTNAPVPSGPAWSCTAFGYLFQASLSTGPGSITQVDLVTGAAPQIGTTPHAVNAVGYNTLDNYMYGWDVTTNQLVRIAADGSLTELGAPAGTAAGGYNVGDFDSAGHLWVTTSAGSAIPWAEIDLAPGSPTYGRVLASGTDATLPAPLITGGADWSWINGNLYGVGWTATSQAYLTKWSPTTHAWSIVSAVPVSITQGVGATFSDGKYLYASENTSGFIYRIDPTTGTTIKIANGPSSTGNDGARCATAPIPTITVTKQVAGRAQPADQFTVGLKNSTNTALTSATTTGVQTTVSTTNWPVSQGATYTITDAMKAGSPDALSAYTATISCTDKSGATVATGGSAPNWTLTVANPTDYTCVVTNTPGSKSFTVTKTASTAGPVHPGDKVTYSVVVQNTGPVPYTAASPASFTDDLANVLDDATYNGDATNGATFSGSVLSWSGALAAQGSAGDSVTITYSVTVNTPDSGDQHLGNTVVTPPGGNCPAGSTDPACMVSVPVQSFRVVKSTTATAVTPGATVPYTITVTNTGSVAYTAANPASFTDDLSAVLDDATYNTDVAATAGTAGYSAPTISWSGPLAVGATVTVTYSVTINDPDTGNHKLDNTAVTPGGAGGNCPTGSTDPSCSAHLPSKSFTVVKSASQTTAVAGDTITYTLTVTNTGQAAYTAAAPASLTDDLSGVLDDAAYNGDASATAGTVTYASPTLSWTGPLAVGATVTITYSVQVDRPDNGDGQLQNAVTTPTGSGGNCAPGTTDHSCGTTTPVRSYTVTKSASTATAQPGDKVTYTITVTNTGAAAYTAAAPASISDDLSAVLDDATYDGDAAATAGTANYASPTLSWSGPLPVAGTVTITYSVTVNKPATGDGTLSNAANPTAPGGVCADGSTAPCSPVVVQVASYTVTKAASPSGAVHAGDTISYTITVHNPSTGDYTAAHPASFTDDLSAVLDDATYNHDATGSAGAATYTAPTLSWSGALAAGATVTVTYTVTVDDPDTGNGTLTNAADPSAPGGTCADGSAAPCPPVVDKVQSFSVTKSASTSGPVHADDVVTYTVVVQNTGPVAYSAAAPASFTDDLATVLDDATYNGDADNGATVTGNVLSWSGALAAQGSAGDSVTITYSVTVDNPDTGDGTLANTVVTPPGSGGNCPTGSNDPACSVSLPVQSFRVVKTTTATDVTPGATVPYTITVTNTGDVAYTALHPASFSDDLSNVLDDASYNGDATASGGVANYAAPTLFWSGPLDVGATVTITYSVTVMDPDPGDHHLDNAAVTPPGSGGNCASGSTDPACSAQVPAKSFSVVKTASAATAVAGDKITYTLTVTNTGQAVYAANDPASLTDDLTGVLDDATYNGDAAATAGTIDYTAPALSWSGALAVGAIVTITYTVTVHDPDTGDGLLTNTVVDPPGSGGSCVAGNSDPACGTTTPVRSYTVSKSASTADAQPGEKVTYTITVSNTGAAAYTAADPASISDDLTAVLDDAAYDGDATATAGATAYTSPTLSWSGPLTLGGTVTLTYSVTVTDPDTGDGTLTNAADPTGPGGVCSDGSAAPCSPVVVQVASYTVSKTSSANGTVHPGDSITYTVTVHNSSSGDYTAAAPASFTDDLSAVLDDATYNHDAMASAGSATFTGSTLSWSGALAAGATVTVTYSVTVADPDTGDQSLTNAADPSGPGGTCADGSAAPCPPVVNQVQSFTVTKAASTSGPVHPGDVVTYTVVVQNTGPVAYTAGAPASFTDSLANVLDDATYNGDADNGATVTGNVLSWSGALAAQGSAGDSVTITYSVTVNTPDTGDQQLANAAVTPPDSGGNCPTGSTDPACSVVVPVQSFRVVKTATTTQVTPGGTVTYTITVTNTGGVAYTAADPASLTDDLTSVLDDASYDGNAAATRGTVAYNAPTLSWSGALPVGATATITYSVTVNDPDTGDHKINNTVVTPANSGGNCAVGSTDPACGVQVPAKSFSVAKVASQATAVAGDTINYTLTVTNTGQVDYTAADPASLTDDLTAVLDDATYNGDATVTAGTVSYSAPTLSWSGPLAVGATATISYTVTVHNPDTGDHQLHNTVTTPAGSGGSCAPGNTDPGCGTTTPVRSYTVAKTASTANAQPGDTVTYTITVSNTGAAAYTAGDPASVTDDLTAVLDDAAYNGDASATAGTASYTSPTLSWSGPLPVGGTVTITYSVTLNDPASGDGTLTNAADPTGPGGVCSNGSAAPCGPVVVHAASYTVSKTSSANGTVHPGDTITYTVTVHNPSAGDYTAAAPASFTDDLSAVLDDAAYNGDASATAGTVSYAAPALSWSGALAAGATVTVTYTVTVADPDTGDGSLTNAADPDGPGGTCADGSQAPCPPVVNQVQSFTVTKTASAATAKPGDTISYTLTVTNTGQVDYPAANPASLTDDLAAVIDDATYNGDAAATAGTVDYSAPTLSWSGALPVGGTVTITYSVNVNDPDTGDHTLANTAVTPPDSGGGCPAGSTDPACSTSTPIQSFSVVKTADQTKVVPGGTVTYTVLVTNTGTVDYTVADPASFTDDLSAVLDDATYNGDAAATAGTVTYAAPTLSWSGPLAVGDNATVTYTVTVNSPDTGDQKLDNTVVTPSGSGGSCPAGSTDPQCTANVPGNKLTVSKTASTASAEPGQKVTYTITAKNTGQTDFTAADPATLTDDLSGVLDDASYNGDASNGATVTGSTLSWSGALAVGDTATITYSVTVKEPDTGDKLLSNTVVLPPGENSNCTAGSTDPACQTVTPVAQYQVVKKASISKIAPGGTVTYTITVTNTGQVAFTAARPASFTDDLSKVLDDASYNHDASNGATYTAPKLSWSGPLSIGGTLAVTYSVTVHDPDNGDGRLDNVVATPTDHGHGPANCAPNSSDQRCATETMVEAAAVVPPPSSPPPAFTGNETQLELELAGLLLGAGGLLVLGAYRRRRRSD